MSGVHAPGPWAVERPGIVVDATGLTVAIMIGGVVGRPAYQAGNESLVAAAPELLEHMLAVASYADAPHVDPLKALAFIRDTARAAIAKATGEAA